MASPVVSESAPRPKSVLVYDWNEKVIWRTSLDGLRETAFQVFAIPRPSYMLHIYGLRIDLSSHTDFEELHVINMPPGSYCPPETYRLPPPSAWQPESDYDIPSTSGSGSFGAKLSSSIPFHDVHRSYTQSTSDTRGSSPKILHAIREDIIRVYPSSSGWYHAAFTVRWELDQYLETELDFDPEDPPLKSLLEPVLTITGRRSAAYATTATSYLEWVWPDGGAFLLRHLRRWAGNEGTVSAGLPGEVSTVRSDNNENGSSSTRVVVKGGLELIIKVAQQLAWLTAVFRKPQYGQTSYSEVAFNQTNDTAGRFWKEFEIRPLGLRKVRRSFNTCWLRLFSNCVIAFGFPTPKRRNGERGIELPYELMVSQAGILFPKTYKEGLFLKGLSTLIYPTASWENHQLVQWHITYSDNPDTRLLPGTIPLDDSSDEVRTSRWMCCTDLQQLASAKRTFLGYCKDINIHLATEDSELSHVTNSLAEHENPRPGLRLDSFTLGTSGMGTVTAQGVMHYVRPNGLVMCSKHETLPGLLDSAQDRPLLVYDDHPKAQKGWLVPTFSVVLHMVHVWARDKKLLSQIPFVVPCSNADRMARELIERDGDLKLRQGERKKQYERLRDVVNNHLVFLESLRVEEALAERARGVTVTLRGSMVCGWDLVDVATFELPCLRKEHSIDESWTVLSNKVLVLFCQGLGELIRPAPASKVCSAWDPIPSKRQYLTATVPCLQKLSLKYGGSIEDYCLRLADKGYWHCLGNDSSEELFEDCDLTMSPSNRHKCEKAPQQISKSRVDTENGHYPPTSGAVVFGTKPLPRVGPPIPRRLPADHATRLVKSASFRTAVKELKGLIS